jgi:hypothetical protein
VKDFSGRPLKRRPEILGIAVYGLHNSTVRLQITLTQKQHGVLLGMAVGLKSAVALIVIGGTINPFGFSTTMDLPSRMSIAIE